MAFGQPAGPPASPKQISFLQSLLAAAGHDDFRTARHEFGLTQRQAGGRFTVAEAAALIDRLQGIEPAEPTLPPGRSTDVAARAERRQEERRDTQASIVRGMPADLLAIELEGRGWVVIPPV